MYFLSKNMCFLRIISIFCAKPKKSGPADDFSGDFHRATTRWKALRSVPCPEPRFRERQCAAKRWFALFSRHLPAHRNRTIEFDMLLLLIRLYFFVFSALLFVSPGFDFAGKIMLGEQPKYARKRPLSRNKFLERYCHVFQEEKLLLFK